MRPPTLGLCLLALSVASQVLAQTPPPSTSTRQACRSSAMSLCRTEALSGDRAAVRACMIKNFDKATPECQIAMKAAQAKAMTGKPATEPTRQP
jgi:hypothetical protein